MNTDSSPPPCFLPKGLGILTDARTLKQPVTFSRCVRFAEGEVEGNAEHAVLNRNRAHAVSLISPRAPAGPTTRLPLAPCDPVPPQLFFPGNFPRCRDQAPDQFVQLSRCARAEQQRLQQDAAALEACTFRPVMNLCANGRRSRPACGPAGASPRSTAGTRRPATPEVLRCHCHPCPRRTRAADAVGRAVVHMPAVWEPSLWHGLSAGDALWHGGSLNVLQGRHSPVATATHTRNTRHLQLPRVCAGALTVSQLPQGRPCSAPSGAEAAPGYRKFSRRRQLDPVSGASQSQESPLQPAPPTHLDSAEPSLGAPVSAGCLPPPVHGSDKAPEAAEVEAAAPVNGCDDAQEVTAASPANAPDDTLAAAGIKTAPPVHVSDDAPAAAEVMAMRARCHETTAEACGRPAARSAAAGGPVFGRLYHQALASQRGRAQSAQAAVEAELAELAAAKLHATPVMPAAAAGLAAAAASRRRPASPGLPPPPLKTLPLSCLPSRLHFSRTAGRLEIALILAS